MPYNVQVHVYTNSSTSHIDVSLSNGTTETYFGANVGNGLNGIRNETAQYGSRTDDYIALNLTITESQYNNMLNRAQGMASDLNAGYGLVGANCLDFVRYILAYGGIDSSNMSAMTTGAPVALRAYAWATDFMYANGASPVLNLIGDVCENVGSAGQAILDSAASSWSIFTSGDLLGGIESMVGGFVSAVSQLVSDILGALSDFLNPLKASGFDQQQQVPPPIVIDLDGDGVHLLSFTEAHTHFKGVDGRDLDIGWASSGDGFLVFDENGNGKADGLQEIILARLSPTAKTDLEGLASLDSDHNGVFNSADTAFNQFLVWRDANGDGVSDPGETMSLTQAGVVSINLALNGRTFIANGNLVSNTTTVTMANGDVREAYDVALFAAPDGNGLTNPPNPWEYLMAA